MPFTTTTLATLQTRLAERYDQQPFWTADQARRAINEGLRIWNAITGTARATAALQTVPNDPFLPVGGTVEKVTRVRMGTRTLNPTSLFDLDQLIPNWEAQTTATGGSVPTAPRFWAPVGVTEIALWPADASIPPSALTVDGIVAAPILVNPGDFLTLGDEEINTLLGYALHVLSFAKGSAALQATRPLYLAFLKSATEQSTNLGARSLYRKIVGLDRTRLAVSLAAEVHEIGEMGGLEAAGAGGVGAGMSGLASSSRRPALPASGGEVG